MVSYGLNWKPGFRMNADWELAERNAWRNVFDVPLDGCLFHFGMHIFQCIIIEFIYLIIGQANWRRVQEIGLSVQYVECGKVRLFVWHLLSMSHVPIGRQEDAVGVLREDMLWFEDMSNQSPGAGRLFEKVEELFK